MSPIAQPPLPSFEVHLTAPDIGRWIPGNTGIAGFTTRASGNPGPHVAVLGIAHGNEIAGAIVLDRLLHAGLAPARGRLTFGFINLAAYDRFDPRQPTASRFVEEDINRVWDPAVLDGQRSSIELERAREIRPLIDTVDVLLDLHSMLWPSDPLILCGTSPKGRSLAFGIGVPALVVADHGHVTGRRLIDYPRFAAAATPCSAESGRGRAALGGRHRGYDVGQHCRPAASSWHGGATSGAAACADRHGATLCRGHHGGDGGQQQLCLRATIWWRRHHSASRYADRIRWRDGDSNAARRLPADYAELAPEPGAYGGAAGTVRFGVAAGAGGVW